MEKLTINLPPVEIARIDILVEAGYYPSRAEFMRVAIRQTLDTHQDFISKKVDTITTTQDDLTEQDYSSRVIGMGLIHLDKNRFEQAIMHEKKLKIRVVGLLDLDNDVTPEHIEAAVESVKVYGIIRASPQVKVALRIKKGT